MPATSCSALDATFMAHLLTARRRVILKGAGRDRSLTMKGTQAKEKDEIAPDADDSNALSTKQELALQAVISHPTLKEAALAAGISKTTLCRYMQDEAFARRLREARRDAVLHAGI